jgi:putative spermidine/putrescine transport system permease protein
MPIEMYGVIMEYPQTAGAVFALILIIPSLVLLFALRKYIGPNAMAGGFKMK